MKPQKYRPQNEPIEFTPEKLRRMLLGIPYPIIMTIIYLILGFVVHLWHPMWMLFLTIPIYYALAANRDFIDMIYRAWQRRRQDDYDD